MLRLQALTPEEMAFLAAPVAAPDGLSPRLTRRLAATLTARLRLPIQAAAHPAMAPAAAPATPRWQPDAALAALWLTRRLGGRHVPGEVTRVPQFLIHTLEAVLAESWLDAPGLAALPPALAWRITCDLTQATLAVDLPQDANDMTRWAREVIRHG